MWFRTHFWWNSDQLWTTSLSGDRRYAHWGKAHRKKAHGKKHIRLLAHPDTCSLGYLHTRGFAHSVTCTLGALHTELCTLILREEKNWGKKSEGSLGLEPAPFFTQWQSHTNLLSCTFLHQCHQMRPNVTDCYLIDWNCFMKRTVLALLIGAKIRPEVAQKPNFTASQ